MLKSNALCQFLFELINAYLFFSGLSNKDVAIKFTFIVSNIEYTFHARQYTYEYTFCVNFTFLQIYLSLNRVSFIAIPSQIYFYFRISG